MGKEQILEWLREQEHYYENGIEAAEARLKFCQTGLTAVRSLITEISGEAPEKDDRPNC